jgi:hypothetical protein
MTTLIINTPDATRAHWNAVRVALNRQGLELHHYHSRLTDGGMTLVAYAFHPDGEVEERARAALAATATEASLYVLH